MYHDIYLHSKDYRWTSSLTFQANWLSFQAGVGIDFNGATVFGHPEYGTMFYIAIGPFCLTICIHYNPHSWVPEMIAPEMLDDLLEKYFS